SIFSGEARRRSSEENSMNGRLGRAALVGMLAVCLGTGAAVGQGLAPTEPAALFAAARPHLEGLTRARWPRGGLVQVVGTTNAVQAPDPEAGDQVRWQFPDLRGDALTQGVQTANEALAAVALVRAPTPEAIFVFPEQARRMSRWDDSLARLDS